MSKRVCQEILGSNGSRCARGWSRFLHILQCFHDGLHSLLNFVELSSGNSLKRSDFIPKLLPCSVLDLNGRPLRLNRRLRGLFSRLRCALFWRRTGGDYRRNCFCFLLFFYSL